MNENPYQSPLSVDERPFIPAWRRAVSIALIVLGSLYSLALPSFAVESVVTGKFDVVRILIASLVSAMAGTAVWIGIWMRRRTPTPTPSVIEMPTTQIDIRPTYR
jgi:hypothetical protein